MNAETKEDNLNNGSFTSPISSPDGKNWMAELLLSPESIAEAKRVERDSASERNGEIDFEGETISFQQLESKLLARLAELNGGNVPVSVFKAFYKKFIALHFHQDSDFFFGLKTKIAAHLSQQNLKTISVAKVKVSISKSLTGEWDLGITQLVTTKGITPLPGFTAPEHLQQKIDKYVSPEQIYNHEVQGLKGVPSYTPSKGLLDASCTTILSYSPVTKDTTPSVRGIRMKPLDKEFCEDFFGDSFTPEASASLSKHPEVTIEADTKYFSFVFKILDYFKELLTPRKLVSTTPHDMLEEGWYESTPVARPPHP